MGVYEPRFALHPHPIQNTSALKQILPFNEPELNTFNNLGAVIYIIFVVEWR